MEEQYSFEELSPRLPSRYEDLDDSFRGSLRPNDELLTACKAAFASMRITGGIRFLPIFGQSGSGKSSATLEIGTHIPEFEVRKLTRDAIYNPETLESEFSGSLFLASKGPLIAVVDQFEEKAIDKDDIPKNFIEKLAVLDGSYKGRSVLVIWLTTDQKFQSQLEQATSRRSRLLAVSGFTITGPDRNEWPEIVSQTFSAHNSGKELADFQILDSDVVAVSSDSATLGASIQTTGERLARFERSVIDLSDYQVVMLWPVTDGRRIETISRFSNPRQGYRLN